MTDQEYDDGWDRMLVESGYVHCRPCDEWHRPPECPVDSEGHPLMPCGCRWDAVEAAAYAHPPTCRVYRDDEIAPTLGVTESRGDR